MFTPNRKAVSNLLRRLASKVSKSDVLAFACDEVFGYSHVPRPQSMLEPLSTYSFPSRGLDEYQFVISEIGGRWREDSYSLWFRVYMAALYVFAESKANDAGDIEYYFHAISALHESDSIELSGLFSEFLETVFESGNWSIAGRDYWPLLSWLLARRLAGKASRKTFVAVYQKLNSKEYQFELETRTKCGEIDIPAWLTMENAIPLLHAVSHADFSKIISGEQLS